jgi:hypothetical protein
MARLIHVDFFHSPAGKTEPEWQDALVPNVTYTDYETRATIIKNILALILGDDDRPLLCTHCKTSILPGSGRNSLMIHTHPALLFVAAALACSDTCIQAITPLVKKRWEEEKRVFQALDPLDEMRRQCAACRRIQQPGEAKFQQCSRCKTTHYCSTACQKTAWPIHQRYCFDAEALVQK